LEGYINEKYREYSRKAPNFFVCLITACVPRVNLSDYNRLYPNNTNEASCLNIYPTIPRAFYVDLSGTVFVVFNNENENIKDPWAKVRDDIREFCYFSSPENFKAVTGKSINVLNGYPTVDFARILRNHPEYRTNYYSDREFPCHIDPFPVFHKFHGLGRLEEKAYTHYWTKHCLWNECRSGLPQSISNTSY